jgi:hypothetical protein
LVRITNFGINIRKMTKEKLVISVVKFCSNTN